VSSNRIILCSRWRLREGVDCSPFDNEYTYIGLGKHLYMVLFLVLLMDSGTGSPATKVEN
jgi:hypothetical protein